MSSAANIAQIIIAIASIVTMLSVIIGLIMFFTKIATEVKTANEHLKKLYDPKGKANFVYNVDCIENRTVICSKIDESFEAISKKFENQMSTFQKNFEKFEQVNIESRQKIFNKIEEFYRKEGETKTLLKVMTKELEQLKKTQEECRIHGRK